LAFGYVNSFSFSLGFWGDWIANHGTVAQMSDWEERDKSWKKFRQEVEGGKRAKLARRLGMSRLGRDL
jgi:hypothetical protein